MSLILCRNCSDYRPFAEKRLQGQRCLGRQRQFDADLAGGRDWPQSSRQAGRKGRLGSPSMPRGSSVDVRPQFRTELTRPRDGLAVVTIVGEVDLYTAPKFHEVLLRGIDDGARQIVVDLSAVTFIDSTALGVLVHGAKRLGPDGGALHLVCGPGGVRRILEITGLAGSSPCIPRSTRRWRRPPG